VSDEPITIQEVQDWLFQHRKNAAWLSKTLGISQSTPSRWAKGDPIPEPSQHLLRLLIRGIMPPGFSKPHDPAVLAFTPAEWRVMEICRVREGFDSVNAWIVSKIRAYLTMSGLLPEKKVTYHLEPVDDIKVAEDERSYGAKKTSRP
jgi:hypothetical protein